MDVLKEVKSGARIMVTMPSRENGRKKYSLTTGEEVSDSQFLQVKDFLVPDDAGLFGGEPQSYKWSG
jgi:hypothetical protein